MMVRPKVVHIALLNWTSDLFPSLSRALGRKRFQLLTKTGTLSRKSREFESVCRCVLSGGKYTQNTGTEVRHRCCLGNGIIFE